MLEDFLSAEVLVIGILQVGPDHPFITQIEHVSQVVQPHHQADRFIGMAGSGGIGLFELLFKTLSIDTLSQFDERMFWIDEISQQMMMVEEGYLPPLDS